MNSFLGRDGPPGVPMLPSNIATGNETRASAGDDGGEERGGGKTDVGGKGKMVNVAESGLGEKLRWVQQFAQDKVIRSTRQSWIVRVLAEAVLYPVVNHPCRETWSKGTGYLVRSGLTSTLTAWTGWARARERKKDCCVREASLTAVATDNG